MSNTQQDSPSHSARARRRSGRGSVALFVAAGATSIGLIAGWALKPLPQSGSGVANLAAQPKSAAKDESPVAILDLTGFNAPLWIAPPPLPQPTKPPAPPSPPPPLKWQLIAIESDGTSFRAFLYDPDEGKVLGVREGDRLTSRQVARITATAVEIRDGGRIQTLMLADREPEDDS